MTALRRLAAIALLAIPAGCAGLDLWGGPVREMPRDTGPLTVPPHMKDGAHQ